MLPNNNVYLKEIQYEMNFPKKAIDPTRRHIQCLPDAPSRFGMSLSLERRTESGDYARWF
jgi:hypothetical protein|tara:strand:+ start:82 stop:261 length:180 start_codon:yes stop_codon:yes gene_type:complete